MKSFAEIEVGETAWFEVLYDEKAHADFGRLSGDSSPIHTSDAFCGATRYGTRLGYGFFLMALLSRFYGEFLPGGSSVCLAQTGKFINPFHPGDTLRVTGAVANKVEAAKVVEIKTQILVKKAPGSGLVQMIFEGSGLVELLR